MSDSRDRGDGPPVDSDAFQAWVEHTAETRGVDKQELLNQLVSAFWILDEMNGVTSDADLLEGGAHSYPPDTVGNRVTESEPPERSATDSDAASADSDSDIDGSGDSTADSDEDAVVGELRALRESMHTQLEMVETVSELRRQVSDLSLDVEQQRSRQDQFTDRISDDLTRIQSRIETLDAQRTQNEAADAASVEQLSDTHSADIERLEETHEEFESWVDEEFDHIEDLFNHLLDTVETFEARLDEIDDRIEAAQNDDAADELASLRRTALELGVDTGRCEECGIAVDLSLLDTPQCPGCEARFITITSDASGWNPFAKPTIQTADPDPEELIN